MKVEKESWRFQIGVEGIYEIPSRLESINNLSKRIKKYNGSYCLVAGEVFVYMIRRVSATQNILKFTVVTYTLLEHPSILPQSPES